VFTDYYYSVLMAIWCNWSNHTLCRNILYYYWQLFVY